MKSFVEDVFYDEVSWEVGVELLLWVGNLVGISSNFGIYYGWYCGYFFGFVMVDVNGGYCGCISDVFVKWLVGWIRFFKRCRSIVWKVV